jgi:hypothetical protein
MLCGIQVGELFKLPTYSASAVCVAAWGRDSEQQPAIPDVIISDVPVFANSARKALTRFAAEFLEAARQEQKLIEVPNA